VTGGQMSSFIICTLQQVNIQAEMGRLCNKHGRA